MKPKSMFATALMSTSFLLNGCATHQSSTIGEPFADVEKLERGEMPDLSFFRERMAQGKKTNYEQVVNYWAKRRQDFSNQEIGNGNTYFWVYGGNGDNSFNIFGNGVASSKKYGTRCSMSFNEDGILDYRSVKCNNGLISTSGYGLTTEEIIRSAPEVANGLFMYEITNNIKSIKNDFRKTTGNFNYTLDRVNSVWDAAEGKINDINFNSIKGNLGDLINKKP